MVKIKLMVTADIPIPKIGDRYGNYGICGRPMYHETEIKRVTKTHIHLKDDKQGIMKEKRTKIPLVEYFYHKLMHDSETDSNRIIEVDGEETKIV